MPCKRTFFNSKERATTQASRLTSTQGAQGYSAYPAANACRGAFASPRRLDVPLTRALHAVSLFVAPAFNDWPE
jgi:hypothetical protein